MNAAWTRTASTVHNLGLAAGFGGGLLGQMALHPAVKTIDDQKERGELLNQTWRKYSPANALGLAAVGVTWLAGRAVLSGGEIDDETRGLVNLKDVLVGIYCGTGIASIVLGRASGKGEPPVEAGNVPSAQTPEAKAMVAVGWLGKANIAAAVGLIAVAVILNVKAGRSHKWSLLSKILP